MRTYLFYADEKRSVRVKSPSEFFARFILFFHGVLNPTLVGSWK